MIRLNDRHGIVQATAIFSDKEIQLETKPTGEAGLPRCHFLPVRYGDFDIQLRLDWKDRSYQGDPTLDADIKKNGRPLRGNRAQWHHTSKVTKDGIHLYRWKPEIAGLEGLELIFRLQTTSQHTQEAKSAIAS